jgi:hypothetical protein
MKKADESIALLVSHFSAAASVGKKSDDCGCGCEGCEDEATGTSFTGSPFSRLSSVVALSNTGPFPSGRNAVNLKVLAAMQARGERVMLNDADEYRVEMPIRTKAGVVKSRSRSGQALQAIASIAIPGDMSDIRSPIRSTVYEALTPGGGGRRGLLGRIGGQANRRCPAGYEHGGRFANRTFTNCGAQLFQSALAALASAAGEAARGTSRAKPAPSIARGRRVGAGEYGDSEIVSREAFVPPMSKPSSKKRSEVVAKEVRAANSFNGKYERLVRADGTVLAPVTNIARISKQRNNPDIMNGSWVTSVASPTNIGGEEVSLFGAGVTELNYAMPGSGNIRISANKPITPSRASALRRALESSRRSGDEGGAALREMVRKSNGDLSYSESFPGVDKPNEMVVVKKGDETRTVARWIYESWMSSEARGKDKGSGSWTIVDVVQTSGAAEAMDGTAKISATAESLASTDSFRRGLVVAKAKTSDYGAGRRIVTMDDGTKWAETETKGIEHLGFVVGNDIANAMGVQAPRSFISGEANQRRPLVEVSEEFSKARADRSASLADVPGQDLARVVLLDYLTDNRGRTPGNLVPLKGPGSDVASFSNGRNMLASGGRPSGPDLPAYLKQDGSSRWLLEKIAEQERIKQKIAEMYEQMVENSSKFDWVAYSQRLSISGLTDAEKKHLETIRSLFEVRADRMKSSRKSFLKTLGVTL